MAPISLSISSKIQGLSRRSGGGGVLPSITAFTVGPQIGGDLPVEVTLVEGLTPPTAIYIVGVVADSGAPSAAQIIAGEDSLGAAADLVASIADAATGIETIAVSPPATGDYDFYAVAVDAGAAQSNVASALAVAYEAYNPSTDLQGYLLTIDPSEIGTLFTDTSGTVPVTTAGDLVACVRDPFTNAIVATQATSGNRPIYGVDSGGLPYLQMADGSTNRWLVTATNSFTSLGVGRSLIAAGIQQDARPALGAVVKHGSSSGSFSVNAPSGINTTAQSRGAFNVSAVFADNTAPLPRKMLLGMYATIPNDLVLVRLGGTERARNTGDQGTTLTYANAVTVIGADGTGGGAGFQGRLYGLIIAASATTDYVDADIIAAEGYVSARLGS
jgi:hypothetical protein